MEDKDIVLYKVIKDKGIDSAEAKKALSQWVKAVKSRIELLMYF